MGTILKQYWDRYGSEFPKMAACAKVLLQWPTVSTEIERSFSEISAHYSKQRNRMKAETLLDIHHSTKSAHEFFKMLKQVFDAHNIKY